VPEFLAQQTCEIQKGTGRLPPAARQKSSPTCLVYHNLSNSCA
jgi:hypothetical protein